MVSRNKGSYIMLIRKVDRPFSINAAYAIKTGRRLLSMLIFLTWSRLSGR